MKRIYSITILFALIITGCNKVIDLAPQSNLNTATYYSTFDEINNALTGCYNGLQAPMNQEWMLTDLRTDVSRQGVAASSAAANVELNELDMFTVNPPHAQVYNYWSNSYYNIRNTNIVLQNLGVTYNATNGANSFGDITVSINATDRKRLVGEALFLRAYHYFNLVRLFGGVFTITEPISAEVAKTINRSSVDDVYKLIIADLKMASDSMATTRYSATATTLGRATGWSAKTLLAKVYLTQNRKAEAITVLNDVIANSGHALQSSYANVFATTNEANSEIIFGVRYKAGGLGLGSPFANSFAALNSGAAVVNGDGRGLNTPTTEIDTAHIATDGRRATNIAIFGTGATARIYVRKYISTVVVAGDAENDWPVLRYADVLLMLAEAQGYNANSIALINQIRTRAALPALTLVNTPTVADFEAALSNERRLEFAFENHRMFDLIRFNTTTTSIRAINVIRANFAREYARHYSQTFPPVPTLAQLQANVTEQKLLLPIPQREIDTNTRLTIAQNPGY
jgi:starch-binding outer membrane protein, SusD/RagB family